ncbi:hypothetical protein WJR50_11235 [Catalinimonas sp. 4WD22]|uniref:hypothetical protein n=1 Tax=Catalinimonas locisalis TaxID=3133978 RepID=UPI00310159CD
MTESYIQYAAGYQKDDIDEMDIKKAIQDIQEMEEEHAAFWVSIITKDENIIEVNKDLSLSVVFDGEETKYQATDWNEVEKLLQLLLNQKFEEIKEKII